MRLTLPMLLLAVFLMSGSLYAHGTLFGPTPRTIWPGGMEFEAEYHWEIFKRYYEGDSPAGNPRDERINVHHATFAYTYGISRDWAVRAAVPVAYAHRESKDGSDSRLGLADSFAWLKYRFYNDPFEGGSWQSSFFTRLRIPTADRSEDGKLTGDDIEFGNETWQIQGGWNLSYSTRQFYAWFDLTADVSTRRSGTGDGPGFAAHAATAIRVFELTRHDDFDLILLIEADFAIRERGDVNGHRNVNSGYIKTHAAFGIQMNITNRFEIKLGYFLPLWRQFYGRQFVHEGEAKISFNYLI